MDLRNFEKNMKRMCQRFNRKVDSDLFDIFYDRLSHIPEKAFDTITDAIIDDMKFFPTPMEIKNRYFQWRKDNPQAAKVEYYPDETDEEYFRRITVSHLWQGLHILKNKGEDPFMDYCNSNYIRGSKTNTDIDPDDVDGIRCKLRMSLKNHEALTENIGEKV